MAIRSSSPVVSHLQFPQIRVAHFPQLPLLRYPLCNVESSPASRLSFDSVVRIPYFLFYCHYLFWNPASSVVSPHQESLCLRVLSPCASCESPADDDLAAGSQAWADACVTGHSSNVLSPLISFPFISTLIYSSNTQTARGSDYASRRGLTYNSSYIMTVGENLAYNTRLRTPNFESINTNSEFLRSHKTALLPWV